MQANPPHEDARRLTPYDGGTRQLLQWGGSMVGVGLLCAVLLVTVLGGYSRTGASTNTGWFALIVALMCLPFGGLLLILGIAKWRKNLKDQGNKGTREQEIR